MEINQLKLSKILSYVLRHAPKEHALILDENGWTDLKKLVMSINNKHPEFNSIDEVDIFQIVQNSSKKRIEIKGDKIRALYGHSIKERILKAPSTPPEILLHGTSKIVWEKIKEVGIQKMNRQYVHLTENMDDAKLVAKRKSDDIIIIRIDTLKVSDKGLSFYNEGNVWLTKFVPPDCIYKL